MFNLFDQHLTWEKNSIGNGQLENARNKKNGKEMYINIVLWIGCKVIHGISPLQQMEWICTNHHQIQLKHLGCWIGGIGW